jgi:hypothetical protein
MTLRMGQTINTCQGRVCLLLPAFDCTDPVFDEVRRILSSRVDHLSIGIWDGTTIINHPCYRDPVDSVYGSDLIICCIVAYHDTMQDDPFAIDGHFHNFKALPEHTIGCSLCQDFDRPSTTSIIRVPFTRNKYWIGRLWIDEGKLLRCLTSLEMR